MGNLSILDLQNRIATGGFGIYGNINSSGNITGASLRITGINNFNGNTNMTGFLAVDGNVNFNSFLRVGGGVSTSGARLEIQQNSAGTPIISLFASGAGRIPITFDIGNYGFIDFHSDSSNGVRMSSLNTGPLIFGQNTNAAFGSSTFASGVTITSGGVTVRNDITYGAAESMSGNIAAISGNNADALDYGNSTGTIQKTTTTGDFTTTSTSYVADGSNDTVSITLSQSGIVTVNFNCLMGESSTTNSMSGYAQLIRVGGPVLDTRVCPSFAAGTSQKSLTLYGQEALAAGTYSYRAEFLRTVNAGSSTLVVSWRQINASAVVRNG